MCFTGRAHHPSSGEPGGEALVRQLCWRDFYHQLLAARPDASWQDYRTRDDDWSDDHDAFETWRLGRTGFPVVDAGMRQLAREGFMHNRARMITASFLTKDLYIDWRWGASHFLDWLTDGDIANNNLNWQWTAGTGTDSNPYRVFNPTVQGPRFDPDGDYVRRYVPELADVPGPQVHDADPETDTGRDTRNRWSTIEMRSRGIGLGSLRRRDPPEPEWVRRPSDDHGPTSGASRRAGRGGAGDGDRTLLA